MQTSIASCDVDDVASRCTSMRPKKPAGWLAALLGRFSLSRLLAVLAFVLVFCAPGFKDPDFYWHLKTGELIARTGTVPTLDPYSSTFGGKPWVAHEWLSELIFHWVDAAGGFQALRVVPALAAAACFLLMFAIARRLVRHETVASLVAAVFFLPLMSFFILRPQIFTYVCFTACLLALIDLKYFRSKRLLWLIPVLTLGWVNLHGAYILGMGLLLAFIITEWCNARLLPSLRCLPHKTLILLGGLLALVSLATLVNPQGPRILAFPFQLVTMEASRSMLGEWQSPDFQELLPRISLAGIFLYCSAAIYAKRKPDITEALLPAMAVIAGLTSWRHLPLMGIVLMTFTCVMLREVRVADTITSSPHRRQPLPSREKPQVSRAEAGAIHLMILSFVMIAALINLIPVERSATLNKRVPLGAIDYLLRNDVKGKMLNDYDLGGYLIYRLSPEYKVFIDGRADLYGDAFIRQYMQSYYGEEGWDKLIEQHGIEFVITSRDVPLRQTLLADGRFAETYLDKYHAVLLRRNIPRFHHLIGGSNENHNAR